LLSLFPVTSPRVSGSSSWILFKSKGLMMVYGWFWGRGRNLCVQLYNLISLFIIYGKVFN
jgi:hypothetical protein